MTAEVARSPGTPLILLLPLHYEGVPDRARRLVRFSVTDCTSSEQLSLNEK